MSEKDKRMISVKGFTDKEATELKRPFYTKEEEYTIYLTRIILYYQVHGENEFGDLLKRYMKATHYTIEKLSEETGISKDQIGRMRRGKVKQIRFSTIIALCIGMRLTAFDSEQLLNAARYTLNCNDSYVSICKTFLLQNNITVTKCNEVLRKVGLQPLSQEQA